MNRTGCGLYFLTIRKPTQKVTINEITIFNDVPPFFYEKYIIAKDDFTWSHNKV